jgi:diacylglycerol kinase (ATP)
VRVLVYHNPRAGHELRDPDALVRELQRAGHDAYWENASQKTLTDEALQNVDVIVAAGGDGNVSRTVRQIVGRSILIAVLPLGTANNLAAIFRSHEHNLIERLGAGRKLAFDVGTIEGLGSETVFVESVGIGAFAETAALLSARERTAPPAEDRDDELDRDIHALRERIRTQEPRDYEIEVDGDASAGRCLMLEIMNTSLLGPNVVLVPRADPSDGALDIAVVDEEERGELAEFVGQMAGGQVGTSPVRSRRATRVRLVVAADTEVHVDGKIVQVEQRTEILIGVRPRAVTFLVG